MNDDIDEADERILSTHARPDESNLELSLRPQRLVEYIGQDRIKDNLRIAIAAAQKRGEPLDHVLLYGPPGLGKTTLACVLANEMGVQVRITSGPAVERHVLTATLSNLQPHDVLFIDEIHRLPRSVEEILYPAMEDFAVDLPLGKGPGARSVRLALPHFTLIGATTRYSMLSAPLRDRFGAVYRLDYYDGEALRQIITRSADVLNVSIDEDGVTEIARRSRGTPRVANRLLRRVRDYAQVMTGGVINGEAARAALARLDIDELGLDEVDHRVLRAIIEKFRGGPVGIETIAASISEEADTIEDVYEPYLLQLGFLQRTPRGREVTQRAYEHLKLTPPKRASDAQPSLFND